MGVDNGRSLHEEGARAMRSRLGLVFLAPAALAAGLIGGDSALGQAPAVARVDPYQGGAAPAFPTRQTGATTTATQAMGFGYGVVDPMLVDPVAMNYLYATGIPMTRGQVGLSAVSSLQQMTGLGSGRLSGVRGGVVQQQEERRSATHTRNPNVPGGQAARYFNRVGTSIPTSVPASASAANSQRFYGRQSRYFPQPAR